MEKKKITNRRTVKEKKDERVMGNLTKNGNFQIEIILSSQ